MMNLKEVDVSQMEDLVSSLNSVLDGECTLQHLNKTEELYEEAKLLLDYCEERVELRNKLIQVYKRISEKRKEILVNEFNEKSNYIVNLIDTATNNIENGKVSLAGKFYSDILEVFSNLPEGFQLKKENLQLPIKQLYDKLQEAAKENKNNKIEEVIKLIDELTGYCKAYKNKNTGYARYLFKEVTDAFSEFPDGYLDVKANIFEKLVDLHKELFQENEVPSSELSFELVELLVKNKELRKNSDYTNLLKFLRNIEHYKKTNQFDKIKDSFITVNTIYHSLPDIEEKKKVYSYLKKIAKTVDLLNITKMKNDHNEIDDYYIEYSLKYPEENEVLNHVRKKQLVFSSISENKFTDGFQVRNTIEEINKKTF